MISVDELRLYITALQSAGITGKAKIGDIEITIPPLVAESSAPVPPPRSQKAEYDNLLFACTEGLREDEDVQS